MAIDGPLMGASAVGVAWSTAHALLSASAGATPRARTPTLSLSGSHRGPACPTAANPAASLVGGGTRALGSAHRHPWSTSSASADMGKKARPRCASCGTEYKQKGDKSRFCSVKCAATTGPSTNIAKKDYGDVPPAFAGASVAANAAANSNGGYNSDVSSSSSDFQWDGFGVGKGSKGGKGNRKRKKRAKKAANDGARPVEEDPKCVAVLHLLDRTCSVISGPGRAMDEAVAQCASCDVIAVDCEGVNMSRVGPVTLLQVATDTDAYLFDVQAMGRACFEMVSDAAVTNGANLKSVLEDPKVVKLMFDCRVDSDALFHQHGVSLQNVFDVQLADVAARRRNHHAVSLLSGMPKCAARWLPKGANQAEANLAANDGKGGFDPSAPPDAVSIARVTEHLKRKVKEQYASNLGGDGELWARRPLAEDVRRYAALDAWLLKEIYAAMEHGAVLDEDWRVRVVKESDRRVGEYRDLTEPIMQFRSQERAQAPDL